MATPMPTPPDMLPLVELEEILPSSTSPQSNSPASLPTPSSLLETAPVTPHRSTSYSLPASLQSTVEPDDFRRYSTRNSGPIRYYGVEEASADILQEESDYELARAHLPSRKRKRKPDTVKTDIRSRKQPRTSTKEVPISGAAADRDSEKRGARRNSCKAQEAQKKKSSQPQIATQGAATKPSKKCPQSRKCIPPVKNAVNKPAPKKRGRPGKVAKPKQPSPPTLDSINVNSSIGASIAPVVDAGMVVNIKPSPNLMPYAYSETCMLSNGTITECAPGLVPVEVCIRVAAQISTLPQDPSYKHWSSARIELLQASRLIMRKTSITQKPTPKGQPKVWADSRQALCETVLYYQAWQGACYISKGVLYSFMFDSNGHQRDLIDQDVVIARAGGAMGRDKNTKEMLQCRDQLESSQTQAVRAAIASQNPIVIFCGNENTDIPVRMPNRYNSLDWFKPTHVWAEKSAGNGKKDYITFKYRFEKLSAKASWWTAHEGPFTPSLGFFDTPENYTCPTCHRHWQQIYLQGPMCLDPVCDNFWLLPDGFGPSALDYDPRFLKQKTPWLNEKEPYDLRPALPRPGSAVGEDTTFAMTRGLCCPKCGKCTSRYRWKGWSCSNEQCHFEYAPSHPKIPATYLRDPWHPLSNSPALSHDWAESSLLSVATEVAYNYRIMHYTFPGIDGRISHFIANDVVLRELKGPDEMFEALQSLDCGLERRRFVVGKEEYMQSFTNNHGMPYKFIASGNSQSFQGAPWPLNETRSRLSWAARLVLGDKFAQDPGFNELLTIGYFGGQNIKYHDDGEKGLGETVASLSLGYPADMSFRVKQKHWTGVSKSGVFNEARPLPGTLEHQSRLEMYNQIQRNGLPAGESKIETLRAMAKTMNLQDNIRDRKPWLRLRLSHGDVVVMHGHQIQEYLEHQVDPMGVLRFGLTARTILPGHLKPEELPSYEVLPDDGHYDGSGIKEIK